VTSHRLQPLFLLSLPRTGSTLVQRVLGAHPEIATVSEPWLLLPHLYGGRSQGIRAEYWQETAAEALSDFRRELTGGEARYRESLRQFVLSLYEAASPEGTTYFLDKTPHYHAVAAELDELFPDGKFVVLWRNPLAVLASLLRTFRASRFEPYLFAFDLFEGIDNLIRFVENSGARAHCIRYEDLVSPDGEQAWIGLFGYLGLEFDPVLLNRFADVPLRGRYGDPNASRFATLNSERASGWQPTLRGSVRRAWCRHWLTWIGRRRLAIMGYDLDLLRAELTGGSGGGGDAIDLLHLASSLAKARARAAALKMPDSPRPRYATRRG